MDQAAPTPMISNPKLDNRLAVQMRRNTARRSGARMLLAGAFPFFDVSLIALIALAPLQPTRTIRHGAFRGHTGACPRYPAVHKCRRWRTMDAGDAGLRRSVQSREPMTFHEGVDRRTGSALPLRPERWSTIWCARTGSASSRPKIVA